MPYEVGHTWLCVCPIYKTLNKAYEVADRQPRKLWLFVSNTNNNARCDETNHLSKPFSAHQGAHLRGCWCSQGPPTSSILALKPQQQQRGAQMSEVFNWPFWSANSCRRWRGVLVAELTKVHISQRVPLTLMLSFLAWGKEYSRVNACERYFPGQLDLIPYSTFCPQSSLLSPQENLN